MKDFKEFLKITSLENPKMEWMYSDKDGKFDFETRQIYNACFYVAIRLLKMYHEWLNKE